MKKYKSISINSKMYDEISSYCKKRGIVLRFLVEKIMREGLEKYKKDNN